MTKTLAYTRPHSLTKLHAELLAAVPSLRPQNGAAVMRISGNGTQLVLEVPDAADEAQIGGVVTAHDPTPLPVPPAPTFNGDDTPRDQLASAVSDLRTYLARPAADRALAANWVPALATTIRLVLFMLRRMPL